MSMGAKCLIAGWFSLGIKRVFRDLFFLLGKRFFLG